MTPYIITVTDTGREPEQFDVPCNDFDDLTRELRAWVACVTPDVSLEVFRFNEDTLDYDLVDAI